MNHHRRSIRLKDYDYSQEGAYFVTLCTYRKQCLFGEVIDGEMRLNEAGEVVRQCWLDLPNHYPNIDISAFVIMPNHVHGVLIIKYDDRVGAGFKPAQNNS